jgi:hypothetical protein
MQVAADGAAAHLLLGGGQRVVWSLGCAAQALEEVVLAGWGFGEDAPGLAGVDSSGAFSLDGIERTISTKPRLPCNPSGLHGTQPDVLE